MKDEKKAPVAVMLGGCMAIVGAALLTENYGGGLFFRLTRGREIIGTNIEGRWVMLVGFAMLFGGLFWYLFSRKDKR